MTSKMMGPKTKPGSLLLLAAMGLAVPVRAQDYGQGGHNTVYNRSDGKGYLVPAPATSYPGTGGNQGPWQAQDNPPPSGFRRAPSLPSIAGKWRCREARPGDESPPATAHEWTYEFTSDQEAGDSWAQNHPGLGRKALDFHQVVRRVDLATNETSQGCYLVEWDRPGAGQSLGRLVITLDFKDHLGKIEWPVIVAPDRIVAAGGGKTPLVLILDREKPQAGAPVEKPANPAGTKPTVNLDK